MGSGILEPGFRCREDNLCIPRDHICNKLENCPDGSDEEDELCKRKLYIEQNALWTSV